jgi:GTP pyrophosphokinase
VEQARRRWRRSWPPPACAAEVQGRPKHLYSIWKKMQGKGWIRAHLRPARLRVIVDDIPACYAALARVHDLYVPVPGEFDDYIAKPKPNGYQSLHTVVRATTARRWRCRSARGDARACRARRGRALGLQGSRRARLCRRQRLGRLRGARRRGAQGRAAPVAGLGARLRERDADQARAEGGVFDDRIYVFTPQATVIELPAGATPVDFAYSLHTDLGHRCRGARVDGAMVPLNTPLMNGQTVEVIAAKEGGPSRTG